MVQDLCALVSFFSLMSVYSTVLCLNMAQHTCVSTNAYVSTCSWRVLALVQSTQLSLPASQQSLWQDAFVTQSQTLFCAVRQSSEDQKPFRSRSELPHLHNCMLLLCFPKRVYSSHCIMQSCKLPAPILHCNAKQHQNTDCKL